MWSKSDFALMYDELDDLKKSDLNFFARQVYQKMVEYRTKYEFLQPLEHILKEIVHKELNG